MKKISTINDITINGETTKIEELCSFGGNLCKRFGVVPADDPISGLFGCIVFEQENDDNSLVYSSKVYEPCDKILCESGDDFFNALQGSLDADRPTFICHQPTLLRIGFISLRNSGNRHYSLRLTEYKRYMDSKTQKV